MPELRKDPIVGRWVVLSEGRSERPSDFDEPLIQDRIDRGPCPFCVGNEGQTPPEVFALRGQGSRSDRAGWMTRVVPNKFPALEKKGDLDPRSDGPYRRMNGVGAHEIIIESTDHDRELSELDVAQVERVLTSCRERFVDLRSDPRLEYILLFKNHGARAGATLRHGHSQLIATPIVPLVVMEELEGSRAHYNGTGRCIFCDLVELERRERGRLVLENGRFLSVEPFAPRFPFETWILPKRHQAAFEEADGEDLAGLASILRSTLRRIRSALDRPHYNYVFHTAPCRDPRLEYYHWHIEITPKQTPIAGFEWGSGFYINPTSPEAAARILREVPS